MTRAMMSQIETQEMKLDWVSTYEEGLDALEAGEHDVYLIDYFLEDRTGMDLLREADDRSIQAPLIMLTGRGNRQVDLQAMKAGAADYLVKGRIDPELLERSIRFALERNWLAPLPDRPPEIATWAKVKVHRDAHVQFAKCLYSVPFRLMGQTLWLKATPATVRIYRDHELVATHPRLFKPGSRSTLDDHMPPEALAYKMRDPQWCLRQSERIGPACHALIQRLFAHRVLDNLRAAQGIIRLNKTYGAARLEAACQRALDFDNPRYGTVKTILQKGLDAVPTPEQAFDALADSYTGRGRFSRPTHTLLKH